MRGWQSEGYINVCVRGIDGNMDGTMSQQVCKRVLQEGLLPCARATFATNFFLVQDNAPPHSAGGTRDFLENQEMKVMELPDMNSILHFWDQVSVHICNMDYPPTKAAQLLVAVKQAC